uniref:Uncharacterized protein n=1 Tax=Setaria italica TaxID=4555 RepID=K3XUC9_SETIT
MADFMPSCILSYLNMIRMLSIFVYKYKKLR